MQCLQSVLWLPQQTHLKTAVPNYGRPTVGRKTCPWLKVGAFFHTSFKALLSTRSEVAWRCVWNMLPRRCNKHFFYLFLYLRLNLAISAKMKRQSIYCQHALRPHASYMYSGMAVRTALAIGITASKASNSEESRVASPRTWWWVRI